MDVWRRSGPPLAESNSLTGKPSNAVVLDVPGSGLSSGPAEHPVTLLSMPVTGHLPSSQGAVNLRCSPA